MRILVVGRDFPSKENNMMGSFEYGQAKMLARFGHEVFYTRIDLRSFRHWRKIGLVKEKKDGVNLITLNLPIGCAFPAVIRNRLYSPLRRYLLKKISQKYGVPDIVNVHYPSIFPYSMVAFLQRNGAKIIGTEHWSKVQNRDLPENNLFFLKEFVKKADALTCVGTALKNSMIQLTGTEREIHVIPNIVSPAFTFRQVSEKPEVFHFLSVGRLSEEKGFDKLIRAFVTTFQGSKYVHLHIVGGGAEYNKLHRLIIQNNAEDLITLHGIMTQNELAEFYHQCAVLIMPSDYETFGVPAAEAMASGLPVIITRNTGMACYVTEDNGIIIDNNSVDNISVALKAIKKAYDRFDKRRISEFAIQHFSEAEVYQLINRVFEETVMGEHNDNS